MTPCGHPRSASCGGGSFSLPPPALPSVAPLTAALPLAAQTCPAPPTDPAHRPPRTIRLAAARTISDDSHFAIRIRQRAHVIDRRLHVAHGAIVRHAAGRADACAVFLGRRFALAELQIRHECRIAVMREATADFLVRLVPTGHVMYHHHAGKRAAAKRPRKIGVDLIAVVPAQVNCFSQLGFVSHEFRPFQFARSVQHRGCKVKT